MAKFFTPQKLSDNIRKTPEGFLLCLNVPIARTGWQEYGRDEIPLEAGSNGIVRVHRDAKEVFRPQTIASFQGKAFTIKHPEEFVDPSNWTDLAKGTAHNIRKSDELDDDGEEVLLADIMVTDAMCIKLIENGLREISCGYEAEYEQTGEGEGRQFNIIGNHIALVENGRAGKTYAINDHKREGLMKSLKEMAEMIKNLGKTVDAAVEAEAKKKPVKVKDEDKEEKEVTDAEAYDALMAAVKDLSDKVAGLGKSKDEDKEEKKPAAKEEKKKEPEAKDEDEEESEDEGEEMKLEERVKALEAAISKLLDKGSEDEEESEDEDEEESEDDEEMAGMEDEEGNQGEESQSKKKTGDAALAEILAPGVKVAKGEDLHKKVLSVAYKTKEGKEVIDVLNGGKKLTLDSKERNATLFTAAAHVLKAKRGTGLEKTKDAQAFDSMAGETGVVIMTAEKMNEINAAHYQGRK